MVTSSSLPAQATGQCWVPLALACAGSDKHGCGEYANRGLLSCGSKLSTLIDDKNKFIAIKLELESRTITFKDSARIFPVSLNELCQVFNRYALEGKFGTYKPEYNQISVLDNPKILKELLFYNQIDCEALYNAMNAAQTTYLKKYLVDINTTVSTSSLAMKIFRTLYQDKEIPILPQARSG